MKHFVVSLAAALLSACVSVPSEELYSIHQAKSEKNDQQHVSVGVAHSVSTADSEGRQ